MIDSAKITVKSGNGGNGIVSFAREPHNPLAGPSGGNGGNGGDVIFVSDISVKTLSRFSYKRNFSAGNGGNGGTTKKQGFSGEGIEIQVPVGTVLSFKNEDGIVEIIDLDHPKKQIILIKGGRGGLGNAKFTSSTNREPLLAESGEVGKTTIVSLELKLLADVGIIGMPNAGKSSLLRSITSAKPKVGEYPFTTLEPKLGTVINDLEEFVVVDIPGLIKDAHMGVGIGHDFLKHIQRTKILIHLVDGTSENIPEKVNIINNEMKKFDKSLLNRPQILVINKADLDDVEILKNEILIMIKNANINFETLFVSALSMKGIDALLRSITKKIKEVKTEKTLKLHQTEVEEINIIHPKIKNEFDSVIKEKENQYKIIHPRAIRIAEGSDLNDWSTLIQFQGRLERMGVNDSLRKLGIKPGDTVLVSEWNFEWD